MGLLPAALLTELSRPTASAAFVLEITYSSTTTIRLSNDPVASQSLGFYEPWIESWGNHSRRISGWRGGLQAPTLSVQVSDVGLQFTSLYGLRLRGKAVTAKLVSKNVAAGSYFSWFAGVVDGVSKSGNRITISMRQSDDQLDTPLTKAALTRYAWPFLPAKVDSPSEAMPVVVGKLDSTGFNATGMVQCPYVDSSGFRYGVSLGWDVQVLRVYSGGTLKAVGTDYAVAQAFSGDGRKVTVIDFVADQGTNEVIADVETPGLSSGPAVTLKELLRDHAYNDYHSGSFGDATAPVQAADFTTLDAMLVTALGYSRAVQIPPGGRTGRDLIKDFCESFEAFAYWRYDGKLSVGAWEYRYQNDGVYQGPGAPADSTLLVLDETDFLSEPEIGQDSEATVNRLLGKSGIRPADGSALNQRTAMAETGEAERAAEVRMPWMPGSVAGVGSVAYLRPNGTVSNTWAVLSGAATAHEALDDTPPGPSDGNGSYVQANSASGGQNVTVDFEAMPSAVAIQSVALVHEGRATGTVVPGVDDDILTPSLTSGATTVNGSLITGWDASYYQRHTALVRTTDPNTSASWTEAGVNAARGNLGWDPMATVGKQIRESQLFLEVAYTAAADVSPRNLSVLSRRLNRYKTAPYTFRVKAPLRFMDLELGSKLPIQSRPHGWGNQVYERRLHALTGIQLSPGEKCVELTLEDIQDQQASLWIQGKALVAIDGSAAVGDGVAMLTVGSTVTVTRASVKNLDSPAGIGIQSAGPIVQILSNCWPSERYGTLLERGRTNQLLRSSFVSGLTGLTQAAGSGTIAVDTTLGEQFFLESTVTAQHLLLTAGNPHAVETRVTWPVTAALTSGGNMCVSVDYRCSSLTGGDGPAWRLVRTVDGFYWNDGTRAWQAGAVDNALTPATTHTRFKSRPISIGTDKTRTFTFSVSLPAGGTASRTARIGHVQLEEGDWVSSRIVTNTTTVTRSADQVNIGNDKSDGSVTKYTWPIERGTVTFRGTPNWSAADVTAGTVFQLFTLRYDANNAWVLSYIVGTGFVWRARSGGVNVDATAVWTAGSGTELTIQARWTSSLGEAGRTMILTLVVADGTSQASAHSAAYTKPVFVAAANFGLGHDTTTAERQWDGYVAELRVSPFCLSDEEMGL